jgi:serine protease Do
VKRLGARWRLAVVVVVVLSIPTLAVGLGGDKGVGTEQNASVDAAAAAYTRYVTVHNTPETLTVEVPAEWTEVDEGPWKFRGADVGIYLAVSPQLGNFMTQGRRTAPGVFIGASDVLAARYPGVGLLDADKSTRGKACRSDGRKGYADSFYQGGTENYSLCDIGKTRNVVTVARSGDGKHVLLVWVNVVTDADLAAAQRVLASFQLLGEVNDDEHGHGDSN